MTLNATLIVQIFNFLIGYVIISNFFLKPVYNAIKREEHFLHDLKEKMNYELDLVRAKENEKENDWQSCQNYFHEHKPQVDKMHEPAVKNKVGIHIDTFEKEKIASLEKEVIEKLEAKMLQ